MDTMNLKNVYAAINARAAAQIETEPRSRDLDQLLLGGKVVMNYQPQFDLKTGEVRGLEALLRATDANGRPLNPAELIDRAERGGVMHDFGDLILRTACADYSAMLALGCDIGKLSVNVSPLQLNEYNYAERVVRTLDHFGVAFADVELEIVENWSLHDPTLHLDQLQSLADIGVRLAMDDFGTGHANWLNVLKLPFSTLKIDRSLISDIDQSSDNLAVITSICSACESMDMTIVAEGISNVEQLALLRQIGCHVGQGFGLAMPLSADEAMDVEPLEDLGFVNLTLLSPAA